MNELIKINVTPIAGEPAQTCDGRELHAFLEVATRFNDWIAARLNEYGFIEGRDFYCFSSKTPEGGRPAKEYALTLDMGKELAMVERNEKGKQARQYFLDCERRAKAPIAAMVPAPTIEAFKLMPMVVRAGRALGLDKNAAAISANQAVANLTGTNVLKLLGHQQLEATNQETQWFTPTELGQRIQTSARGFNLLLAEAGLQMKRGDVWEVTEAGREFARLYDTGKKHGSGVPIQQIKWSPSVLPLFGSEKDAGLGTQLPPISGVVAEDGKRIATKSTTPTTTPKAAP